MTPTDEVEMINPNIPWCKMISTRAHRHCDRRDCYCPCHRAMAQVNYEKNLVSQVKRLG